MRTILSTVLILLATTAPAFADGGHHEHHAPRAKAMQLTMRLSSDAFANNRSMPRQYSCEGAGIAPELTWSRVPRGTQSLAIQVFDPDAPGGHFTHWLVTGIAPDVRGLPEGGDLPTGAVALRNDEGGDGYTGPCPPNAAHHYIFMIYALDIPLDRRIHTDDFAQAIDGHVIAKGELVGLYKKTGRMDRHHRRY